MPKGIYERKQRTGKYAPGTEHDTPTGRLRVLAYFPVGHRGATNSRAVVEFLDTGYVCNCQTSNIMTGKVIDRRKPSVYGVGYLDWDVTIPTRGTHLLRDVYDLWANMLKRCYGDYDTSYQGCSVDRRWHSFKTFATTIHEVPGWEEWLKGKSMHLDKDILVPGNKVYSRDTCTFVTPKENILDCLTRRWARD